MIFHFLKVEDIIDINPDLMCIIAKTKLRKCLRCEDAIRVIYFLDEQKFSFAVYRIKRKLEKMKNPMDRFLPFEACPNGYFDSEAFDRILLSRMNHEERGSWLKEPEEPKWDF